MKFMNPDELLKSVMENRRGKGLPIALTNAQIMQVWAIDIFPVPVLADPNTGDSLRETFKTEGGEARESNARVSERPRPMDSRGGETI